MDERAPKTSPYWSVGRLAFGVVSIALGAWALSKHHGYATTWGRVVRDFYGGGLVVVGVLAGVASARHRQTVARLGAGAVDFLRFLAPLALPVLLVIALSV